MVYIAAFATAVRTTLWQFGAAALLFAVLFVLQFPAKVQPGRMKGPVYGYAAVIAVMAGYAFSCARYGSPALAALAVTGGALFVVSDAVLALMFFSPIRKKWLPTVNLATYYAAQILLAFSILAA